MRSIAVIGAACGYGAQKHGYQDGPDVLRSLKFLERLQDAGINYRWDGILHIGQDQSRAPLSSVSDICEVLAYKVGKVIEQGDFPIVLGEDHSCAIGTWSGVKNSLPADSRIGLMWIDAHMDSHTYATTPSGAIHGMPLACLLGHGAESLINVASPLPKLHPENVCLIGTRSFEKGEAELLKQLGVRVFSMDEISQLGIEAVWKEALSIVQSQTAGFGVSLDLDVLDPDEEPGVGSPEPGGIFKKKLIEAFGSLSKNQNFLAMEIVEYNPYLDTQFVTAQAVCDLIVAVGSAP